jgi:hypothetical protein
MIKHAHGQKQPAENIVNFKQHSKIQSTAAIAGDVISGESSRYILKPVTICGPLEVVMFAIAERLSAAEKSGYKYIDRIPSSSTESIMIFERIK